MTVKAELFWVAVTQVCYDKSRFVVKC